MSISDDIIEFIIENYTNESGIRELRESRIERLFLTLNMDNMFKMKRFCD